VSTVVLLYHGIGDQPAKNTERRITVSEEAFVGQLDLLRQRPVVSLPYFLAGRAAAGSVVVTFDGAEKTVATRALPLMEERRMVGTVFVTTGRLGTEGYLQEEDLRLLQAKGWTVGSHGVTHRYPSDLSPLALEEELKQSRDALTRILGSPPEHLSLPGGRSSTAVIVAAVRAGYRSVSTALVGVNAPLPDAFAVRRVVVLRPWDLATFRRVVEGDRLLYLEMQARHRMLAVVKRGLGNRRYEDLRARAFSILRGPARGPRTK
jgi:peptidoglycan/xylan/chitin deacetylase (PgdA/CDA1 family)